MSKEKVLVTSALPYANGPIHLGHLSGAYLPADIYVRYKRLNGDDVLYICGSDEHGVPITITADKEKVSPQVIIDRYHESNKRAFKRFGMSFDNYSRTSLPIHHETAKEFFLEFYNRGLFIEKKSNQFYDEKAKMFLPDRYVEGTCPRCGNEQARSDECENCGSLYDPSELINPKSKVTGETPVLKETTHYYFPLGKYQPALENYVNEMNEKYGWKENVLQYCRGWFKEGLKDRAITRDLDWGVKVPVDSAAGKVIYVWFEAVLGYISSTKEFSQLKKQPDLWKKYWQDIKTKYIAFIGKDNVVFHTIIFPAILMAWNEGKNEKYCLPQNVPANEFLNFEGKKFSKSRGWGIDVDEFLNIFPPDPLRYTLAANLPENKDTDFYWKEFQLRNNSELADILGNFINRTFTFIHKHFDGKVPAKGKPEKIDNDMLIEISEYPGRIAELFERYKIKDGVNEMMNLARDGNKYFNDSEPWVTIKSNKEKCGTTLNICLQAIYTLAELFYPVLPFSSEKLFKMLNAEPVDWRESGKSLLKEGHQINNAEILFPKIEDEVIEEQISKLGHTETQADKKPDELISYEDFMKTKLKVAEVLSAEKITKSKKLMKIKVMLDDGERQLVAGIAEHYNPEDLIGKKVVVVANLQPAKLMGEESCGMILAVDKEPNGLQVLIVDDSVKIGTRVK
ncbi:MAG: methionine--tRNA ligase [Ignavibacteriota bacterium]|nr:MAG: methionine--tRNA ligase [Chlorobiota bacterium]MBE7476422.1 methionine--tRNA ligase [Ignavibacteriales bacterium]MBL1124404.1 methionine--tRNA ligase [Ignavibacteriota bacterium]MCZ7614429.1 methionine--tRNA ligase [Ignavibacteriaceae bacterium]MEB2297448.1 methionine--tRNA ligase [Ignavibacteria bacterium]